jgi:hypothetical protein
MGSILDYELTKHGGCAESHNLIKIIKINSVGLVYFVHSFIVIYHCPLVILIYANTFYLLTKLIKSTGTAES